ncbi:hypothetical protein [Humisphaera borealis]|uniref:ABC transporter ATP-binding protein n=1 Tax=Humisphaera borealis TaxID=2807512 RepID=A0A7M2X2D9_9BACT|nr:hypothetical protein [Humisphaera borealis]QOV90920.1 ABC transporter ATP-binding protein [Humisphaera borealis]
MRIEIHNRCSDFSSYRAARVKSLFNCASGADFQLSAELPIERDDWQIGVVVGPSGTGKTSIGRTIWPDVPFYSPAWPERRPIVEAIDPRGDFDPVPAALAAVGLGTVQAWLRPFPILSNGEQFRANLARVVVERPPRVKLDEFTSVVDRQIARVGALAFSKAWRRGRGQVLILTPHYDVLEWLEPCWVFDTGTGRYSGRGLRRPRIELEIRQTDWRYWPLFEPHHYLKLPRMIAATNYVGTVDGELVAHVAVSTKAGMKEARASRLVVMPEWQGAGVGMRFLNAVCELWRKGSNRYGLPMPTLFHTSHPGLAAGLRRDAKWVQVSAVLHGDNRARSKASLVKSGFKEGAGFGGHFRAVQGFRYLGE